MRSLRASGFGPFARFRTRAFEVFNYINAGQTFLNPFSSIWSANNRRTSKETLLHIFKNCQKLQHVRLWGQLGGKEVRYLGMLTSEKRCSPVAPKTHKMTAINGGLAYAFENL